MAWQPLDLCLHEISSIQSQECQRDLDWPSKPGILSILFESLETRLRCPPLFAFHISRDFQPQRYTLEIGGSFSIKIFQQIVTVLGTKSKPLTIGCKALWIPFPTPHSHSILQVPPFSKTIPTVPQSRMLFLLLIPLALSHDSTLPDTSYLFIWVSLVKYLRDYQL